ncbi:MAG TPA: hypothetical protein VGM17_04355 [Rhizomicrobium sp.]|jgi:hypothetical protein
MELPDAAASPDGDLVKEVYAYFGLCMYFAQVFETGLINVLTLLETAAAKPSSQTEHEAIFDSLYARHESLTFGNLLRALAKHGLIPFKLLEEARILKADRDHLAHRFFRDHDLDFATVGGCYSMIESLEVRRAKFSELDRRISAVVYRAYEASGQSSKLKRVMDKIEAEMLDEARDRSIVKAGNDEMSHR